jgi:predicted dehydrogenase
MRTVLAESRPPGSVNSQTISRPKPGFPGDGEPGGDQLEATGCGSIAEVAGMADVSMEPAAEIARTFPRDAVLTSLDNLMEVGVEGIVIATPSALHADLATAALERGMAIFCQGPQNQTD